MFLSATTLRDYFRRGPDVEHLDQIAFDNAGNEGGQAPVFREGDGQQGGNDEVERVENLDGQDDVPFQEMVGMRGPLVNLMENALTVCLRCRKQPSACIQKDTHLLSTYA